MRIIRSLILIIAFGAAAGAQQTRNAPALQARPVETVSPDKPRVKQLKVYRDEKEHAQPVKQKTSEANQSEEDGGVMVDTKAEEDDGAPSSDTGREAEAENAIPSSYGQLKGTLNEGSRGLLVFENEDGLISLVQIMTGKPPVSWKLVAKIARSSD